MLFNILKLRYSGPAPHRLYFVIVSEGIIMDFKQLSIAAAVARYLSFSEAAERLCYSTSVISKQILSLEKEIGVRLFNRNARSRVSLTLEGTEIISYFYRILDDYDHLLDYLKTAINHEYLNFSCPSPIRSLNEESLVVQFFHKFPEFVVRQIAADDAQALKLMEKDEIDIGMSVLLDDPTGNPIFSRCPYYDAMEFIPIEKLSLGVGISEKDPLSCKSELFFSDFKDYIFAFNQGSSEIFGGNRLDIFRQICRREGFEPNIVLLGGLPNKAVCEMIASGQFVSPVMLKVEGAITGVNYVGMRFRRFQRIHMPAKSVLFYKKMLKTEKVENFLSCFEELNRDK